MKKTFKKWGWVYFPISLFGWIITILALAFCIQVFVVVDGNSHSVSDMLYGIFPYIVPTFLAWLWIASKTSD